VAVTTTNPEAMINIGTGAGLSNVIISAERNLSITATPLVFRCLHHGVLLVTAWVCP
jgi:hypothetical protein